MAERGTARQRWTNWSGLQSCSPVRIAHPTSEDELAALVKQAAEQDLRVKVVGAGHSFTPIACTDGVLIDLSGYRRVVAHDPAARTVTVEAGISLHDLSEELAGRGLALENMGDINVQSIAGATSTATHGTGWEYGNLATGIVGMRLVLADGSILEATEHENSEVLEIARVGLGALGVVSTLTLRCVEAFRLHAVEEPLRLDVVMDDFEGFMSSEDHVEFYWVPHTGWALTKRNRRTDEPARPRAKVKELLDDIVLPNLAFGALCRLGRRRPSLVPRLARLMPSSGRVEYVDRSDRVFTSPRWVRFYEMEYAIPREAVPEALDRVRRLVVENGMPISFPVEVRVVASDDIALSTAEGRATGYIAVHTYKGTPYDAYFQGVERIMDSYEGRPHWGKLHFQRSESLAERYPRWADFAALRRRLDPAGRFANPYLDRVLGAVS